jgi:hypothetical protein
MRRRILPTGATKFALALALATGSTMLMLGGGEALAVENAGCTPGSQVWPAEVLPFGPAIDVNRDNIICETLVDGASQWTDNAVAIELIAACPGKTALELHPGFTADRNGDNWVCYLHTGAAHTVLGKEMYVDNSGPAFRQ